MTRRPDSFYVGWAERAPEALARWVRVRVGVALAALLAMAVGAALWHPAPARATFEYGVVTEYTGQLVEHPYPVLLVGEPGERASYLLVAEFKAGAGPLVAGLDGRTIRLQGTLIQRGEYRMLEVHGAPVDLGPGAGAPANHGAPITLAGEVVDSKCHLGAMNPGNGPTHRLCAIRCLLGGIPPGLAWVDAEGRERFVLLEAKGGGPLPLDGLPVARRVEIVGGKNFHGGFEIVHPDQVRIK